MSIRDRQDSMKTLYITDLDGTLLNESVEVSKESLDIINRLIKKGMEFSIATARTAASVTRILDKLQIQNPVVLMNGALVYDLHKKQYINIEIIDPNDVKTVMDVFLAEEVTGFAYSIKNHELQTYFEYLGSNAMKEFYEERVDKYQKRFTKVKSFYDVLPNGIVYFCLLDERRDKLSLVYEKLKDTGLDMAFYQDIYNEKLWYLEIYSHMASKFHAVNFVKNFIHADKVVGFGDNLNDIPLSRACDEFYAVDNAVSLLKERADGIIESNLNHGVAKFLQDNL